MLLPRLKVPILVDPKQISVVFKSEKQKSKGKSLLQVPVLVNTGTFLVYQYCPKMWYLHSLEHADCWCYYEAYNTGTQKWSSIVQYSCTSIWDLKYTFSKAKKQKTQPNPPPKKRSSHFVTFPPSIISVFHLPFIDFLLFFLHFPFFPASLFPVDQQKFPSQKSRGDSACPPPSCYATVASFLWLHQLVPGSEYSNVNFSI